MNQLCKVCGEPAAGYHFGAFTCEGCKSFFGRTYNNLSALGECKNNGQCVINKKNRTSCKSCRLKKCLMVGMSKSGSRYGRRSNWFKIHCLIQDQAEMTRLSDQGMLAGVYDSKDFTDSGGSATSPSGTASPNEPNAAKSPLAYGSPFDPKLSHFEGSPPFDRKDTIVFHHPLPLSPVSPMSPLNPAGKFFFHPPGSAFFAKGYNGISKLCNGGGAGDLSYAPHRYVTVAALNPLLRPKNETSPMDCYADTPEQERPMDLTVKKAAESPDSDVTIITDSPYFPSDECSEASPEARATETPLDLTKRETTAQY